MEPISIRHYQAPLPEDVQPPTRELKDEAFYASMLGAADSDIQTTYEQTLDELSRYGRSDFINEIQNNIKEQHKSSIVEKATGILGAYDKPAPQKLEELRQLSSEEAPTIDNYFTKIFSQIPVDGSFSEQVIQGNKGTLSADYRANGPANQYRVYDPEREKATIKQQKTFLSAAKALGASVVDLSETMRSTPFLEGGKAALQVAGSVGSGLFQMVRGGFAGIWKVSTENVAEADKTIKEIQSAIYRGDGEAYEKGMAVLSALGELIDVPFRAVGDFAYETTLKAGGSPELAAAMGATFYAVPQAFGYTAGSYGLIKAASRGKSAVESVKTAVDYASPIKVFDRNGTPISAPTTDKLFVPVDSPLSRMERVNRPLAAEVISKAIKDKGVADAIGTTPVGVALRNLLPKYGDDITEVFADIGNKLKRMDEQALYQIERMEIDPWLFDPAAVKNSKDIHARVLSETSELVPQMSSAMTSVDDTGRAFRAKVLFGSAENKGFATKEEAELAKGKLAYSVAEKYNMPMSGKGGEKTWKKLRDDIKVVEFGDGEYFVKWDYKEYFNPAVDTSIAPKATFLGADVTGFALTGVGKWIFHPTLRLPKLITAGFARADFRSTTLQKVWEDVIRNEILATSNKAELATLIKKGEEKATHWTVEEIRNMYPELPAKQFKALVNAYEHYRRLDDHIYLVLNKMHRDAKITAGYTGLYDEGGKDLGTLGRRVEPKQELGEDLTPIASWIDLPDSRGVQATEVYDFRMVDEVLSDGTKKKKHVGATPVKDLNLSTTAVYKLDKPYTINGKQYEYGINANEGPVKQDLLPRVKGHYPHINKEPYFIKAIPKQLYINGNPVDRKSKGGEEAYQNSATTVGVADTESQGKEAIKAYSKENPDYEYIVVPERTDVDKSLVTYLDAIKYGADLGAARKKERLKHGDGRLSTLEDPLIAINQRVAETAKLLSFKDVDFEFRRQFVDRYGEYTDHKFPDTIQDIKTSTQTASSESRRMVREAQNLFNQYLQFNKHSQSILTQGWKRLTLNLAHKLEDISAPLSQLSRWASEFDFPLERAGLNLATVRAIHLNAVKQWFVQPSQLHELAVLGLAKGNPSVVRDIYTLGPRIFSALLGDAKSLPSWAQKGLKKSGQLFMDDVEFNAIVQAFKDTGIPYSLDKHASMDGILNSSMQHLEPTKLDKTKHIAEKAVTLVPQIGKTVGFTGAELMNAIGIWLYARADFIKNNPKKKWNDPHNLELIAERTWGIGNSMQTKGDLLPYQQGFLRMFLQFQAFSNKSAMQVFSSKFLTKEEKIKLAAIRALAYGDRGIMIMTPFTNEVEKMAYSSVDPEDKETQELLRETLDLWKNGLGNKIGNWIIKKIIDEDTDGVETSLDFTSVMSPLPEYGLPLSDFVINAWNVSQGDKTAQDTFAASAATLALAKTALDMKDIYFGLNTELESMDSVGIMRYIRSTARWAPSWNNYEKYLLMKQHGVLVDKLGNPVEVATTAAEAQAQFLGIPSTKLKAYYEVQKDAFEISKHVTETAKRVVELSKKVDWMKGDLQGTPKGPMSASEMVKDYGDKMEEIRALIGIYASAGEEQAIFKAVQKEMLKQSNKGIEGPIEQLFKSRATGWTAEELRLKNNLQLLENKIGPAVTNKIRMLDEEIPKLNFDMNPYFRGEQ